MLQWDRFLQRCIISLRCIDPIGSRGHDLLSFVSLLHTQFRVSGMVFTRSGRRTSKNSTMPENTEPSVVSSTEKSTPKEHSRCLTRLSSSPFFVKFRARSEASAEVSAMAKRTTFDLPLNTSDDTNYDSSVEMPKFAYSSFLWYVEQKDTQWIKQEVRSDRWPSIGTVTSGQCCFKKSSKKSCIRSSYKLISWSLIGSVSATSCGLCV